MKSQSLLLRMCQLAHQLREPLGIMIIPDSSPISSAALYIVYVLHCVLASQQRVSCCLLDCWFMDVEEEQKHDLILLKKWLCTQGCRLTWRCVVECSATNLFWYLNLQCFLFFGCHKMMVLCNFASSNTGISAIPVASMRDDCCTFDVNFAWMFLVSLSLNDKYF